MCALLESDPELCGGKQDVSRRRLTLEVPDCFQIHYVWGL